jgi:hypothetical protein
MKTSKLAMIIFGSIAIIELAIIIGIFLTLKI